MKQIYRIAIEDYYLGLISEGYFDAEDPMLILKLNIS